LRERAARHQRDSRRRREQRFDHIGFSWESGLSGDRSLSAVQCGVRDGIPAGSETTWPRVGALFDLRIVQVGHVG